MLPLPESSGPCGRSAEACHRRHWRPSLSIWPPHMSSSSRPPCTINGCKRAAQMYKSIDKLRHLVSFLDEPKRRGWESAPALCPGHQKAALGKMSVAQGVPALQDSPQLMLGKSPQVCCNLRGFCSESAQFGCRCGRGLWRRAEGVEGVLCGECQIERIPSKSPPLASHTLVLERRVEDRVIWWSGGHPGGAEARCSRLPRAFLFFFFLFFMTSFLDAPLSARVALASRVVASELLRCDLVVM